MVSFINYFISLHRNGWMPDKHEDHSKQQGLALSCSGAQLSLTEVKA